MAIAALAFDESSGVSTLAKPEWGSKRICQSCGARFYDFSRSPIVCPACGAIFDLEILNRARRARPATRAAAAALEADGDLAVEEADLPEADAEIEEDVEIEEDEGVVEGEEGAEEDESLIEDASELGEDEDMSDVIDSGLDEEETR
jgi:uncharacterized protein (TIGR02300 family)